MRAGGVGRYVMTGPDKIVTKWFVRRPATVLAFSMSAGLSASTVTPGSTAPELSFTVPVIDACAYAVDDASVNAQINVMNASTNRADHETRRAGLQRISTPLVIQSGTGD